MKTAIIGSSLAMMLAACQPAPSPERELEHAFDEKTAAAGKACHDHVWFKVPEFEQLPNAAISAFPASVDGGTHVIYWNVNWDEPRTRAAGTCTVTNGKVTAFEDYTKEQ